MFTGIVAGTGCVETLQESDGMMRLGVLTEEGFLEGLTVGASIAVNGVCLTVVSWAENSVCFDVIDETLRCTTMGSLKIGAAVNLERAAKFGDEVGGHLLSGHIHTCARVEKVEKDESNIAVRLSVPQSWARYVLTKGYIAINGCSLTVGDVADGGFWLHLIPETLRITNLGSVAAGDELNIEFDHQTLVIVDTVERVMRERS